MWLAYNKVHALCCVMSPFQGFAAHVFLRVVASGYVFNQMR